MYLFDVDESDHRLEKSVVDQAEITYEKKGVR